MVLLDMSQLLEKAPEGIGEIRNFPSVFPYTAVCGSVCSLPTHTLWNLRK